MDAFDALFSDASKVSGTMSEKLPDGTVRTGKLSKGPRDMTPQAFADAAVHGLKPTRKATSDDKVYSRSTTRTDIVTGAAARNAALVLLGLSGSKPDPVPEATKRRGRNVVRDTVPSDNAAPPADGAAAK